MKIFKGLMAVAFLICVFAGASFSQDKAAENQAVEPIY